MYPPARLYGYDGVRVAVNGSHGPISPTSLFSSDTMLLPSSMTSSMAILMMGGG